MAKQRKTKVEAPIQAQPTDQERNINEAANEIGEILKKRGLGMQAVIQIFKPKPPESPIVAMGHTNTPGEIIIPGSGNDPYNDVPPALKEALLKPLGDEIH